MGDLEKLKAIVAREFLERVRTKWFVIITLLGPVLLSLLLFLPAWLASRDRGARASGPIVVLDATGAGVGERVRQALSQPASGLPPVIGAAARATIAVDVRPTTLDSLAAAESLATRAVMDKRAQGYLVIGPRVFDGDSARYSGRNATSVGDMARLTTAVRTALLDVRLERAGVPPERIREVTRYRGGLKTERLTERGRGGSGQANLALALGVSFLLYISIVPTIHTRICTSPTAPTPSTLPASSVSERTLESTTSATRVVFSSSTPRSTFCPYSTMEM